MKRLVFSLLVLVVLSGIALGGGIRDTRHNLSVSGPGPVKAVSETEICIFCHIPHNATPSSPLWGRRLSETTNYEVYTSATMTSMVGQPDGASKLCLSCHDGTIALGAVLGRSKEIEVIGAGPRGKIPKGAPGFIGTDLSGSHPVSFVYNDSLSNFRNARGLSLIRPPSHINNPNFRLDGQSKVQCTSCHDPHEDRFYDPGMVPRFWRDPTWSGVCVICHISSPAAGAHADPSLLLKECGSCHVGHGEPRTAMLPAREEDLCYRCHGNRSNITEVRGEKSLAEGVEPADIKSEFGKPSHHPVEISGVHRADEVLPETSPSAGRHAECIDCHPAHSTPLGGVRKIGPEGLEKKRSTLPGLAFEYQVCYRCHSDSANLPVYETNKRVEFDTANPSYHPVEAAGKGRDMPSLISPYTTTSLIACTDCHGNDSEVGPEGPHGSIYEPILIKNYNRRDDVYESPFEYELCYECHQRESILGNESFNKHREHIVTNKTSCYTCHDSHGSQDYPRLIRFNKDPRYTQVYPNSAGRLEYINIVGSPPECYLSCHDVDHNPEPMQSPGLIRNQNSIRRPIFAPDRGGKW